MEPVQEIPSGILRRIQSGLSAPIRRMDREESILWRNCEKAVAAVFDAITEALVAGDSVSLVGFGKFEVKNRSEKMGINPRTKEPMKIAASKLPAFRAGKALKDAVAK